jgi:hypothetical protein
MTRFFPVLACLAALGAVAPCAQADDAGWSVATLMQRFRAVKSSHAHFVERRYLGMLTEPLKSSGTLAYQAPDKFEKITLSPQPERLVLDGDRLTVDQGPQGQRREFALSQHPEIAAMVESIRGTLAGDPAGLERFYRIGLSGTPEAWALQLEPTDPTVGKLVSSIRIAGSGADIQTIDTRERDGDRTEMIILDDPQ